MIFRITIQYNFNETFIKQKLLKRKYNGSLLMRAGGIEFSCSALEKKKEGAPRWKKKKDGRLHTGWIDCQEENQREGGIGIAFSFPCAKKRNVAQRRQWMSRVSQAVRQRSIGTAQLPGPLPRPTAIENNRSSPILEVNLAR